MGNDDLKDGPKKFCYWTGEYTKRVICVELDTLDRFGFQTKEEVYVKPEFEDNLNSFNNYLVKYGRTFIVLVLHISLLLITAPLIAMAMGYGKGIVVDISGLQILLLGLVIILLPFPTPETINWIGIKRAVDTTRIIGIAVILLGTILFFF